MVALLAQRAEIKYDPSLLLPTQIAGFINNLGFQAEVLETVARGTEMLDLNVRSILFKLGKKIFLLKIEGMTCASCVTKIENYLKKIPGIISVNVVLLTNRGRIQYDPSIIGPRDILKHITVKFI